MKEMYITCEGCQAEHEQVIKYGIACAFGVYADMNRITNEGDNSALPLSWLGWFP